MTSRDDSRPRRPPRPVVRRPAGPQRGTAHVDQWLDQGTGTLAALQAGATVARRALEVAQQVVPAELRPHLWAANCIDGEFSLLFDSAGWATRARYGAAEWAAPLAAAMGEEVSKVTVKVRPRG